MEYQGSRSGQRCPASGYYTRSSRIAVVHCRGHQSQIPRSEIGKGNHHVDQEAKKAACTPTDKIKAVLHVPGLIEEMPQPCYMKEEDWAKNRGLISQKIWYMLDEKIMIPQTQ